MNEPTTVDEYIAAQPVERHELLRQIRAAVLAAAPGAVERISYGMPTYRLPSGRPFHFAAWKHHLGLHAVPVFTGALEAEVDPLRSSKDTVRLPYRSGVPVDLISRIVAAIVAHH